ncbi:RmlC-like cupins superfamily protein [Rhynchospora pubera]|uniref:Germin-like protein n=1 Tax=Rhynchospora pubera TaxID=906938 RepID=A0AAV8HAU0_9POAL|nr:RmlC-like cupins superfamily protein [Rhynchospora pubera]
MAAGAVRISLLIALFALSFSFSLGYDPSPLEDICVADKNSQACKNPNQVTADDFYFPGFDKCGNTSNKLGSAVNLVNVEKLPGLNTLGISMARIDYAPSSTAVGGALAPPAPPLDPPLYAPYGLNPPHIHPRASEILVVLEGSLYVGFVTTDNKLFTKVLNKGDSFVFPIGMVHFQYNYGTTNAVAFAGLSSQNPGTIRVANALFGSKPPISDDVLTKTFMVDKKTVNYIQTQFQ